MDSVEKLKRSIIAQVKAQTPVQTLWAKCLSTNSTEGTMVAMVEGLEYDDVLLGIGSDMTIPAPGSKVLIGLVENHGEATFLILAESVTQRRINGDAFGGVVKVDELVRELNALKKEVNTLKSILSAWVPVPNDGGAALKASVVSWSSQVLQPAVSAQLQNSFVTHG